MAASTPADTLTPEAAHRLVEFARACKAAARVVALYPATHPAIQSSLDRVAATADRLRHGGAVLLTVHPERLLLDGHASARPDPALAELAALLHAHAVGELRLTGAQPPQQWHSFLSLIARAPEEMRAAGGLAHCWRSHGANGIDVRQIDYAEVLRERQAAHDGAWDRILAFYLEGDLSDLDEEALAALFDIASDVARFTEFTDQLVTRATGPSQRGSAGGVLRVLQALADFTAKRHPEQLERVLEHIAAAAARLTPELLLDLIAPGAAEDPVEGGIDLAMAVRARLSGDTIAEFVARSVARDGGATARLAQAFQSLVPDETQRAHVLNLVEQAARTVSGAQDSEFASLWKRAADLLATYSDADFISEEYGRELSRARSQALDVERAADDPPERVQAWLATVTPDALRRLDAAMVLDLLMIESRAEGWSEVIDMTVSATEQLVLAGELPLALSLVARLERAAADETSIAEGARHGLARIRSGPAARHAVLLVRQTPDLDMAAMVAFCRALGPSLIGPLAEALAVEQGPAVKRLREVLLSFGAAGRPYVDQLRSSPNPAVRRTAIDLLRAFGGDEALPDLVVLLDDAEPAVQREAVRAIVQLGTDQAYTTLHRALDTGHEQTRDAIMQSLMASRDERAVPLLISILDLDDRRGRLERVHLAAIEALGKLAHDVEAVDRLKRRLYDGAWWAPGRTGRLRMAAALALSGAPADQARRVLEEAARHGARGVRRAARHALRTAASASSRSSG